MTSASAGSADGSGEVRQQRGSALEIVAAARSSANFAAGVQGHSDVDVEAAFGNSESALAAALVDPPVKQCHVWQKEVALKN